VTAEDGLSYEDTLPLAFEARAELPHGPVLAGLNAENLEVLVADASLDEKPRAGDKYGDEDHSLAEDLQRVESKLNVLIQLVTRLLRHDAKVPPPRSWRLYATGLEWAAGADAPEPGYGLVSLYVSRHLPQPIVLPGRVTAVQDDAHGRWVHFRFEGLAPQVEDVLARLIFRHHRRAVAGTRAQTRG